MPTTAASTELYPLCLRSTGLMRKLWLIPDQALRMISLRSAWNLARSAFSCSDGCWLILRCLLDPDGLEQVVQLIPAGLAGGLIIDPGVVQAPLQFLHAVADIAFDHGFVHGYAASSSFSR